MVYIIACVIDLLARIGGRKNFPTPQAVGPFHTPLWLAGIFLLIRA